MHKRLDARAKRKLARLMHLADWLLQAAKRRGVTRCDWGRVVMSIKAEKSCRGIRKVMLAGGDLAMAAAELAAADDILLRYDAFRRHGGLTCRRYFEASSSKCSENLAARASNWLHLMMRDNVADLGAADDSASPRCLQRRRFLAKLPLRDQFFHLESIRGELMRQVKQP